MAEIIGGVATTHVPSIGGAIANNKQNDPYWKPFFSGFDYVHRWLADTKPDVAVVFYNDHGLNFFLDKLPTFAVGAANEYRHADEGWGLPVSRTYPGDAALSWHLIESLVADEFDVTMCQEMLVDHAFTIPLALLWPEAAKTGQWPVRIVPVEINTVQHPMPSLARCLARPSIGRALESFPGPARGCDRHRRAVAPARGERAGFINKDFDKQCMDALAKEPEAITRHSIHDLVELAGAQGVELLNWMAMRGALTGAVTEAHRNYHIPVSNTAGATMVFENRPTARLRAAEERRYRLRRLSRRMPHGVGRRPALLLAVTIIRGTPCIDL
jgi:protocatechuate 4,5-dioxygenase beta chain